MIDRGVIVGHRKGTATARLLNMKTPQLVRLRRELVEQGEFDVA